MATPTSHYGRQRLENDLVALELFDPRVHVTYFLNVLRSNPDVVKHFDIPIVETEEDFMEHFYTTHFGSKPDNRLYVVFDKTTPTGEHDRTTNYAGIIALSGTSYANAATEIGIIIFPSFQRTHVATNATGLLLLYTLDCPSAGGLGLRRVMWQTNVENLASRRAAERLGFEYEGVARWQRVVNSGMPGLDVQALEKRNGGGTLLPGRHTAIYSIVWEEWENKRGAIIRQMERRRHVVG